MRAEQAKNTALTALRNKHASVYNSIANAAVQGKTFIPLTVGSIREIEEITRILVEDGFKVCHASFKELEIRW